MVFMDRYQPQILSLPVSVSMRFTPEEHALFLEKVYKYAYGSRYAWTKYAVLNHIPRRIDETKKESQREFMIRAKIDYDRFGLGQGTEPMAEIVINPHPIFERTYNVQFINSNGDTSEIDVDLDDSDENDVFILLRNALNKYIEDSPDDK